MRALVNSVHIDFEEHGAGVNVLLIHGFPLHRAMWSGQIEGLKKCARLIAPDLRGFGKSDVPAPPYGMEDFAEDLNGLLAHLRVERVILCGFSMGGYISFAFQRRFPEKVAGMVLIDTRADADSEEARGKRLEMAEAIRQRGVELAAETMVPKLLAEQSRRHNPDLIARVASMIRDNSADGVANAQLAMASRPDSTSDLGRINCPVLIVVGDQDALTPVAVSEAMAARLPRCDLRIIGGAGHLTPMEYPERVNAAIGDYLRNFEETCRG